MKALPSEWPIERIHSPSPDKPDVARIDTSDGESGLADRGHGSGMSDSITMPNATPRRLMELEFELDRFGLMLTGDGFLQGAVARRASHSPVVLRGCQ